MTDDKRAGTSRDMEATSEGDEVMEDMREDGGRTGGGAGELSALDHKMLAVALL